MKLSRDNAANVFHAPKWQEAAIEIVSPHFDLDGYHRATGQRFRTTREAVAHYFNEGEAAGVWPNSYFDVSWHVKKYGPVPPEEGGVFRRFVEHGAALNLAPNAACWFPDSSPLERPAIASRPAERDKIDPSLLELFFAREWYYCQTPEIHLFKGDPIDHFFRFGAAEGRWPHPEFDTNWYLSHHTSAQISGRNPLIHFIVQGRRIGCRPNPSGVMPTAWTVVDRAGLTLFGDGFRLSDLTALACDPAHAPPEAEVAPAALPDPPEDAAALSLDVWDTLLRRDCHPDEIKLRSARYLLLRHRDRVRPGFRDLSACLRERLACEERAAPNGDFEFTLPDALAAWVRSVLQPGFGDGPAGRETAQDLLRFEIDAEKRSAMADPLLADYLARHDRLTRIFLSDFYMSASQLREIMTAAGVDERRIAIGYASSDTFENKRSGKLFERAAKALGEPPTRLFHIGDNPQADVEAAQAQGVRAVLYRDERQEALKAWRESAFRAFVAGDPEPHLRRIGALVERMASKAERADEDGAALRALGLRLAPVFVGYALSILETAASKGFDRIWFCTREGGFFRRIYDAVAAERPYGLAAPPSRLLHVSRRATFAASLADLSESELMRLWSLYSTQSPKGFAKSLLLDEGLVRERCRALGIDYEASVAQPWRDPGFKALREDAAFRGHAEARLADCRRQVRGYLDSVGFEPAAGRAEALVDIGWRGTIQDNLARITGRPLSGFYFGLYRFLNEQPPGTVKIGYVFDENEGRDFVGNQEVAPIEMICNMPGGSTLGYADADAGFAPLFETHEPEERAIEAVSRPVQEGVAAAAAALTRYVDRHGLTAEELRPLALALTRATLVDPPACLADGFFALEHNESFGTGEIERIGGDTPLDSRLDKLAIEARPAALHAELADIAKGVRWPEGFVRRSSVQAFAALRREQARAMPVEMTEPHLKPADFFRTPLTFVCPAPIRGSGGHRTIYGLARRLIDLGFPVQILLQGPGDGEEVALNFLETSHCLLRVGWDAAPPARGVFATTPRSAAFIQARYADVPHKFYLVQDYEAFFNPIGDEYLKALESYGMGFLPLTIGDWLTHGLATMHGAHGHGAGLGHDPAVYRLRDEIRREKAVAVLYQPEKPRRAPELTLEVARRIKAAEPDARIVLFGSDAPATLDFEHERLGLVDDLVALSRLYNRCRVGLCLSLTNPSRIPFEFMACGTVPVDLYAYNNLFDYETGTALLAHQDAASLTEAALRILRSDALYEERMKNCRRFVAPRTLKWEQDAHVNAVMAALSGRSFRPSVAHRAYDEAPVLAASTSAAALAFCRAETERADRRPPPAQAG